jgi:hypothetical protein
LLVRLRQGVTTKPKGWTHKVIPQSNLCTCFCKHMKSAFWQNHVYNMIQSLEQPSRWWVQTESLAKQGKVMVFLMKKQSKVSFTWRKKSSEVLTSK